MTRLSRATLDRLPASLRLRPRNNLRTGIVHFGPGAFHRAHQASYIDALVDDDPRWGIAAVSLRSAATVNALAEQDGLYTIAVRDTSSDYRLIDVHRAFLTVGERAKVQTLLASSDVDVVSTTVTEKGYCLAQDGTLDFTHPDMIADITRGERAPRSVIGWIVEGLAARRATGQVPFVVLPCDNLAGNGRKIAGAIVSFARALDDDLALWIEDQLIVPSTMVDSITPAADAALFEDVEDAIRLEDHAAVQREAFLQWVIEDCGQGGPDLAAAGATITRDVKGWERAKLRILNGAHSTLAYAGLLRGNETVAEAMRDPVLSGFATAMVAEDIIPVLPGSPGLDLEDYARSVFARFRNPRIHHRLDQIAQDGSQKIPYRLGDTLAANRRVGRLPNRLIAALACWICFVRERAQAGVPIIDPQSALLISIASAPTAADITNGWISSDLAGLGWLRDDLALRQALETAIEKVMSNNFDAMLTCY